MERTELSKRDRSLITVAALTALYRLEQLPYHLKLALENGLTREELIEVMTHLSFYVGWPAAVSGINSARKVFSEQADANGEITEAASSASR